MRSILFVTTDPPWPETGGGKQRSAHLRRAIGRHGRVDLLTILSRPPRPGQLEHLRTMHDRARWVTTRRPPLVRFIHNRLPPHLRPERNFQREFTPYRPAVRALREMTASRDYDLIVCRFTATAMRSGVWRAGPPVVLDIDDVDSQMFANFLAHAKLPRLIHRSLERRCRALRRKEHRWHAPMAHLLLAKEEDRAHVAHPHVSVAPNIPLMPAEPVEPSADDARAMLFVGGLDFTANRAALDHFVPHVWPRIRGRCPGATLRIVGSNGHESDRLRWSAVEGVRVVGFVEDLSREYADCALAVAPIRWGAGTKIKVLEALAYQRACLCTAHAAEGHAANLPPGQALAVAADDQAMIEQAVTLLTDPARRNTMARRGRELILKHYSAQAFNRGVDEAIDRLL